MTTQGSVGYGKRTRAGDIHLFDSLLPEVRAVLREALFDWAVTPKFVQSVHQHGIRTIVEALRRSDAEKVKADRTRVWGLTNIEAGLADLGLD